MGRTKKKKSLFRRFTDYKKEVYKKVLSNGDKRLILITTVSSILFFLIALYAVFSSYFNRNISTVVFLGISMSAKTKIAIINASILLFFSFAYACVGLYTFLKPYMISKKIENGELPIGYDPNKNSLKYLLIYGLFAILEFTISMITLLHGNNTNLPTEFSFVYFITFYSLFMSSIYVGHRCFKEFTKFLNRLFKDS